MFLTLLFLVYLRPPKVKVDLEAIAEKYCPGFNLKEEVEKGFITTDEQSKRTKRYVSFNFCPGVH